MSGGREFDIDVTADTSEVQPNLSKLTKALQRFEQDVKKVNTRLDDATRRSRLDQFEKSWARVGTEVRGVGDTLFNMLPSLGVLTRVGTGAGLAIAGGVSVSAFAEQGRTLEQWSAQLGVSIERLQSLIGAGRQKGIDQNAVLSSLASLSQSLDLTRIGGNPEMMAVLNRLRVGLPTPDQPLDLGRRLEEIADAIAAQGTAERKVDAATRTQTMPLFPLLFKGSDELRRLEEAVPRVGKLSAEAAKQGDELATSLDRLGTAAEGASRKIGESLGPTVSSAADYLTQLLDAWSISPGFGDKLRMRSMRPPATPNTPAPTATATPQGEVPWYKQKPISQMTPEELARAGRDNRVSVSGPDGRVIIQLKVEADPSLRVRAIAQDRGPVQTEIFMPTDAAP